MENVQNYLEIIDENQLNLKKSVKSQKIFSKNLNFLASLLLNLFLQHFH